jgi:hypothetical protein
MKKKLLSLNMSDISETEKRQILSDILNSAEFKDSKRYQDLLKYLFEKSEKEGSVKEIEIAIDVFDKEADFDPNTNPLIRSYISNLRKKLEHYYLTTEDRYTYKLEIPKGQYLVNFVHANKAHSLKKAYKYTNYIYLSIILALIFVLGYLLLKSPGALEKPINTASAPNPVWKEFMQTNSHSTLIVLGDYFFMSEKNNENDRIFIRNTKINSEKDFQKFSKKYPDNYKNLEILKFTYLRPSACFGLLEVLRTMGSSAKNVSIKLASQLKWEDFDKHNIIFLGAFKTLYKLDTLVSQTNIRYSVEPSSLKIIDNKKNAIKSFSVQWLASNYQNDYSVILKIPGSKDNSILFFLGFSEIGVMEAVKTAVDQNFITRIEQFSKKEIPKQSLYFEMVSHSEGIELTAFRSEIKYFNLLPTRK